MAIRVRALRLGYYDNSRYRTGAEFEVTSEQEIGKWMERLDDRKVEPKKDPKDKK